MPKPNADPLIRTEEVDRVERWVDEAIAAGGTLVCGGSRLSDTLFSPTVILDPPESAKDRKSVV